MFPGIGGRGSGGIPAGGGGAAGVVRIPFDWSWMTDTIDTDSTLTGAVTDDGAGRLTFPCAAATNQGTLRTLSYLATAPLSVLAAALGVSVADIQSGDAPIEVIFSNLVGQPRISVGFALLDTTAADQATCRGIAVGIGRLSSTVNQFSASSCKSNTSGATTSVTDADAWTQWLARVSLNGATPEYEATGTLWYPGGGGKPKPFANTVWKEANATVVPTHFGFCVFQEGSTGATAGNTSITVTLAAKTNADSTGQP